VTVRFSPGDLVRWTSSYGKVHEAKVIGYREGSGDTTQSDDLILTVVDGSSSPFTVMQMRLSEFKLQGSDTWESYYEQLTLPLE
jgi:plastocyanin